MTESTQTNSEPGQTHSEWKRRQAIKPAPPRYIEPTLPERINRLNPSERHQLTSLIKSMKLRKIIRRTLAEAFWDGEAQKIHDAAMLQSSKAAARFAASPTNYERALIASGEATAFELTETRAGEPSILELP